MPLPPGPSVTAAPAETPMGSNGDTAAADPMDEGAAAADSMNEDAAAAEIPMNQAEIAAVAVQPVQEDQEMEQDLPGVKELASHRQAAVYNRMDPKPDQLVPYVSLSSSEDESSDSEGKQLKFFESSITKFPWFQSRVTLTR